MEKSLHRQEKVAALINSALIEAIAKGKGIDPYLIDNKITITRVKVTVDLKIAYCYFLPFNSINEDKKLTIALQNSKNAIRTYINAKLKLRYSPDLRFYYDDSFNNAYIVEKLLQEHKPKE